MRRPAKFGGFPSSCAGDIKDFIKSKMAAIPPFFGVDQRLKLIGNISIASASWTN